MYDDDDCSNTLLRALRKLSRQLRDEALCLQDIARLRHIQPTAACACVSTPIRQAAAYAANAAMQNSVQEWLAVERHIARLQALRERRGEIVILLPNGSIA